MKFLLQHTVNIGLNASYVIHIKLLLQVELVAMVAQNVQVVRLSQS